MNDYDLQQARQLARALVQRLTHDPAFRQQVEDDPFGILAATGLPEGAIREVLQEAFPGDVLGYMAYGDCALTSLQSTDTTRTQ